MIKLLQRDEELKKVFRYKGSPCDPMFYRPNLYIHSRRVEWIAYEIAKILVSFQDNSKKSIDLNLVAELARFHDDTEIITGDFLSMDKESFSENLMKKYENDSQKAISILYENYGNISDNFDYKEILQILEKKEGLEFKIVDFADKLDAHLEISHELFAGNKAFSIKLEKWGIDLQPFTYTKNKLFKILQEILSNFDLELELKNTFLDLDGAFDNDFCLSKSREHSLENLENPTGYNLYDSWVKLHFKAENQKYLKYLVDRIEF